MTSAYTRNRLAWRSMVGMLLLAVWGTGCAVPAATQRTNRWATVDPSLVNEAFDDETRVRMLTALPDVPWVAPLEAIDPNEAAAAEAALAESLGEVAGTERPDPLRARRAYLRGRWLVNQGQGEAALAELTVGLAEDPNSPALAELYARAAFALGRTDQGLAAVLRTLRRDPDRAHAWQLLGNYFLSRDRVMPAAGSYREGGLVAASDNPLGPVLQAQLAGVLERAGYWQAAVTAYDRSYDLALDQRDYAQSNRMTQQLLRQLHVLLLGRARLCLRMGDVARAVAGLEAAQQSLGEPVDLVALFVQTLAGERASLSLRHRRVVALLEYLLAVRPQREPLLGWFHEACQRMSKHQAYLDLLEHWHDPLTGLLDDREYAFGLALADQDEAALAVLETLRAEGRGGPLVQRDLGRLYGRARRWEDMFAAYGAYVEARPDERDEVLKEVLRLLRQESDLNELLEQWAQSLPAQPGGAYVAGMVARAYERSDLAEQLLQAATTLPPARRELTELYLEEDRFAAALAQIDPNRPDLAEHPEWLRYAGRAAAGLGDLERAGGYYRQIIAQQPENVQAYLDLADVFARQQAWSAAEQLLLQVQEDWPGRPPVLAALTRLYLRWGAQTDGKVRDAARHRARETLRDWVGLLAGNESDQPRQLTPDTFAPVLTLLEQLREEYPQDTGVAVLLAEFYEAQGDVAKAQRVLEALLARQGDEPELLALAARLQARQGQWGRAAETQLRLWAVQPDKPQVLVATLLALREAGRVDEAVGVLLAAQQRPDWPDEEALRVVQDEAERLFRAARSYPEAVALFESWWTQAGRPATLPAADESDVVTAGAWRQGLIEKLAWALTEAGRYQEAAARVQQLHERFRPERPVAALYLVRMLNVRQRYDQSRALLADLLEIEPDHGRLRLEWCRTMAAAGALDEAVEAVRRWQRAAPGDIERQSLLWLLLTEQGAYDAALEELTRLREQFPDEPGLDEQYAELLVLAGRYDELDGMLASRGVDGEAAGRWFEIELAALVARGDCATAAGRVEGMAEGRSREMVAQIKGQIYATCGDLERATELFAEALDQDEPPLDVALQYAVLLTRQERTDEAIAVLDEVLAESPADPTIQNNLGYTLLEAGRDLERVERLLWQSYWSEPAAAPTLDSLGWLYYKKGSFATALEFLYQAAAGMGRTDAEVSEHLGDTLYRLERPEAARVSWQRAVDALDRGAEGARLRAVDRRRLVEKLGQLQRGEVVTVTATLAEQRGP